MAKERSCWLVKSEPDCFSIEHLARCPQKTTGWSGVRNYQARNYMRDQMQVGDRVLFYHSSVDPPVVAGTALVVRAAYPDHTAWDRRDEHFDPKASPENPIWQMVDIQLEEIFTAAVPLEALRSEPGLKQMELLRRGSRLSVQPVRPREFEIVLQLARAGNEGSKSSPAPTPKSAASKTKKSKSAAASRR